MQEDLRVESFSEDFVASHADCTIGEGHRLDVRTRGTLGPLFGGIVFSLQEAADAVPLFHYSSKGQVDRENLDTVVALAVEVARREIEIGAPKWFRSAKIASWVFEPLSQFMSLIKAFPQDCGCRTALEIGASEPTPAIDSGSPPAVAAPARKAIAVTLAVANRRANSGVSPTSLPNVKSSELPSPEDSQASAVGVDYWLRELHAGLSLVLLCEKYGFEFVDRHPDLRIRLADHCETGFEERELFTKNTFFHIEACSVLQEFETGKIGPSHHSCPPKLGCSFRELRHQSLAAATTATSAAPAPRRSAAEVAAAAAAATPRPVAAVPPEAKCAPVAAAAAAITRTRTRKITASAAAAAAPATAAPATAAAAAAAAEAAVAAGAGHSKMLQEAISHSPSSRAVAVEASSSTTYRQQRTWTIGRNTTSFAAAVTNRSDGNAKGGRLHSRSSSSSSSSSGISGSSNSSNNNRNSCSNSPRSRRDMQVLPSTKSGASFAFRQPFLTSFSSGIPDQPDQPDPAAAAATLFPTGHLQDSGNADSADVESCEDDRQCFPSPCDGGSAQSCWWWPEGPHSDNECLLDLLSPDMSPSGTVTPTPSEQARIIAGSSSSKGSSPHEDQPQPTFGCSHATVAAADAIPTLNVPSATAVNVQPHDADEYPFCLAGRKLESPSGTRAAGASQLYQPGLLSNRPVQREPSSGSACFSAAPRTTLGSRDHRFASTRDTTQAEMAPSCFSKQFGLHCQRSMHTLAYEGSCDHRWWATLPDRCPISHFQVNLLPYPPFKLLLKKPSLSSTASQEGPAVAAAATSSTSCTSADVVVNVSSSAAFAPQSPISPAFAPRSGHVLIDGQFLALQVLTRWDFTVFGSPLSEGLITALDKYLKRCKASAFRLAPALALSKSGTQSSLQEFATLRAKAAQRLQHLIQAQKRRHQKAGF